MVDLTEADLRDGDPLPPIDRHAIIEREMLRELERQSPGAMKRIRGGVASEMNLLAVIRLRGPRSEPSVRRAFAEAARLLDIASLFIGVKKRRR